MLGTYTARIYTQVCAGVGTGTGTTSLQVPDTWLSPVRHQYRYRTLR